MRDIGEAFIKMLEAAGFYRVIIPWLLTFALFYAILYRTKLFKTDGGVNLEATLIVSACLAFLVIYYLPAVLFIRYVLAGIAVFIIVAVFVALIFLFGGIEEKTIQSFFRHKVVVTIILGLVLVLSFAAYDYIKSVVPPTPGVSATENVLAHPAVLSVVLIFGTFIVGALMLGYSASKGGKS